MVLLAAGLIPAAAGAADLPAHALERADLEAWLDGLLPAAIEQGNIAGAVVAVVSNGEVILQKGYGYADVKRKRAVDPASTLFRIGSISKVFTWTAVMQQVELGRIDLDRDITTYLDFAIPARRDGPITMRHLMTHTAGFAETLKGDLRYDTARLQTLSQYLRSALPPRIFPAGKFPAYSNYGASLAGYIVQRVSGRSFEDALDRRILGPLGMQHSTFRQPLPAALAANLAQGYPQASDSPIPFELCGPIPAGSLSTTAADMARFMIAHLQMAQGAQGGILKPGTARLLHDSVTRPIPGLNGISLGFEANRDGRRVIGHGGDTQVFHSDMKLFLDDGAGLFIAFNSTGRDGAAWNILTAIYEQFAARYFPVALPYEPTMATAMEHGKLIAAQRFQGARRSDASFVKLFALLGQQQAAVDEKGLLTLPSMTNLAGEPKAWREVAPFIWRDVAGSQRIGALVENGHVRVLGADSFAGTQVYLPVSPWSSGAWIIPTVFGAIAVLLLTVISWPVAAVVSRRFGSQSQVSGMSPWPARLARSTALANIVFLIGWALVIRAGLEQLAAFDTPMDKWMRVLHALGLIALVGMMATAWNAWLSWRNRRSAWTVAWMTAVAAACAIVSVFSLAFHLISLSLVY